MKEAEVVTVADAGDSPKERALAVLLWADVVDVGDTSEPGLVEPDEEERSACEDGAHDEGLRDLVVPVDGIETISPGNGLVFFSAKRGGDGFGAIIFLFAIFFGVGSPWPSHCVVAARGVCEMNNCSTWCRTQVR